MSDNPASRARFGRFLAWFSLRRALVYTGTALYCLVLLLALDFAWSSLTRGAETQRPARVANPAYDHGFAANFDGFDIWGELRGGLFSRGVSEREGERPFSSEIP